MDGFDVAEVSAQTVATVRRVVSTEELPSFFGSAFRTVAAAIEAGGGVLAGPPFGWYHGPPGETVDVAAGFPVEGWDGDGDDVTVWRRAGGRAVVGVHVGPYETMAQTYARLSSWSVGQGITLADEMWEEYLTGPEADPSTWQTRIVWPVGEPGRRSAGA
jgi:effector-binding domain-containing protein